jgi:hypothetical protein
MVTCAEDAEGLMDLHTTGGKNSDNNISAEFREQFGSTNTLEKSFS